MFISDRFLLESDAAVELYKRHAEKMPVIDYHNHLDPKKIAEDYRFETLTELWLGGDHYKWRAMRANGVDEKFITGDGDGYAKFMKWAETVPHTMRNPLYHWTHLELKRYFGMDDLLNSRNGERIYKECNALLKEADFSVRSLLKRMHVEVLCTTDDPADDLRYHARIAADGFDVKVYPTWRPDKVMAVEDPEAFREYINKLSDISGKQIISLNQLFEVLSERQHYFQKLGCRLSDHGLSDFPGEEWSDSALEILFNKLIRGEQLSSREIDVFRSGMLHHLAVMNHRMGWAQQFHVGAIRNNNQRLYRQLGADIGCDSIGDRPLAEAMSRFFASLDDKGVLAPTILYNLNPKDAEVMMAMACNYNEGPMAGKMQYGAAWWFLDQLDGIERQLEVVSHGGLLSRFVGMLTDSRSFISFPRHEYFRRILCNLLGRDLERGLLPKEEMSFIGQMTEDICYHNIKRYLNL